MVRLVSRIQTDIEQSWPEHDAIRMPEIVPHPIPFFGPVHEARVITVGVNPSWTEFKQRNWPDSVTAEALTARLLGYFDYPGAPPHPWFSRWQLALRELDVEYGRQAAHVDLSPRATQAMGSCPVNDFLAMMERDVRWFFSLLPLCRELRLVLLAGTVTKKWYMNKFLARVAPEYGFRLIGETTQPGPTPTAFGTLVGAGRTLPVFFCGVSPSAYNASGLVRRIQEHRSLLTEQKGTEDRRTEQGVRDG